MPLSQAPRNASENLYCLARVGWPWWLEGNSLAISRGWQPRRPVVQPTGDSWVPSGVSHPTLLKSCHWESECSPSPSGHPLHGPNIQLKACRDKELKASIMAMSCARAQLAKPPDFSRLLGGRGDRPERRCWVVAPLLLHPLHFDFLFFKHGSGPFLAEESGEGNAVPLGVLGHCDGVKGLCTQAALGPRDAVGCGGLGVHRSLLSSSTLSPGHPQVHPLPGQLQPSSA